MAIATDFQSTVQKVNDWARQHAQNDFYYGAPYSYWGVALTEKVISKAEYEYAAAYYGKLWTYRGD